MLDVRSLSWIVMEERSEGFVDRGARRTYRGGHALSL